MTQEDLRSRLIFLDTNTYQGKNFQFESHELALLKEYIETDHAYLLIGDITVQEIKKHLAVKAKEAVATIKRTQKDAMILRCLPDLAWHGIFQKTQYEEIFEKLLFQFERYIKGKNIEIVPASAADTTQIFDDYFSERPPFDGSAKKAEFPDAFVLNAINKISKERGHKLYVVSNDGDLKRYCALHNNLISVSTIGEMLDLIVRNSDELREPVKFADSVFNRLHGKIKASIFRCLQDSEFSGEGMDEYEFEVVDVEIEQCEIVGKRVLEVTREHVQYEVDVSLIILIDYSITDYDSSPWDHEDKAYVFLLTNRVAKRYSMISTVRIDLDYQDGIKDNAEIEEIDIEEALDLSNANEEVVSYKKGGFGDDEDEYFN